jgi:hypothetical protein
MAFAKAKRVMEQMLRPKVLNKKKPMKTMTVQ